MKIEPITINYINQEIRVDGNCEIKFQIEVLALKINEIIKYINKQKIIEEITITGSDQITQFPPFPNKIK